MKTTIFLLPILLVFSITYAQEEPEYGFNKGDFFVSGTVNYNNTKYKSNDSITQNRFAIEPEFGYFINQNLALGTRLNFSTSRSENSRDFETKENGIGIGIFGKYFFTPQKRFSVYGEVSAMYRASEYEQKSFFEDQLEIRTSDNDSYTVAISPGVQFFVSENLALTSRIGNISYNSAENENIDPDGEKFTSENNQFSVNLGLDNLYFGVLYRI